VLPVTGTGRRFYADRAGTIKNIYAWATDNAPSSAACTFDVNLNGTSIYTTNAKPSISIGAFLSADAPPNTVSFFKGDKIEVVIVALGGITTGRLGVQVVFTQP